jgi:hypothetical protein
VHGRAAVEQRDDDDGADVVDDGQRQQEHDERARHPSSERGHDADGEGDVGRHGHAPSAVLGDGQVQQGGHNHPAHGGQHRQHGVAAVAQLALDQLPLDLHADREEEHRHEPVVDEGVAPPVPQVVVGGGPRRVGPRQRGDSGQQQKDGGVQAGAGHGSCCRPGFPALRE